MTEKQTHPLTHNEKMQDNGRLINATRITLATFGLLTLVALANAFLVPAADKTLIDNYTMPFMALTSGLSYLYVRQRKVPRGIYLLVASIFLVAFLYPFAADNVGWQAAIGMLLIVTGIVTVTLPLEVAGRISIAAFLLAMIIVVLELYVTGLTHIPVTTSSIVITSILGLVYAGIILARFRLFPLRIKLVTAFVAVSVVSVGAIAVTISRTVSAQLTTRVKQELTNVSRLTAASIAAQLDKEIDLLNTLALKETIADELVKSANATSGSLDELQRLDGQWQDAVAAGNETDPLIRSVLRHRLAEELTRFRDAFPENVEVFVSNRYGANVAATNVTPDYYQADEEWWIKTYDDGRGGIFIGQPEFDASIQTTALLIAVPIMDRDSNAVVGVLGTTVDLRVFAEALEAGTFGNTGRTEIYLPDGTEVEFARGNSSAPLQIKIEEAPSDFATSLQGGNANLDTTHAGVPVLAAQSPLVSTEMDPEMTKALERLNWRIVSHQERVESLEIVSSAVKEAQLVGLGALLLAGLLALGFTQLLTAPLIRLTQTAERISSGELQARAPVDSPDEIGALSNSFNRMTNQLQETLADMEHRVEDRTSALNAARLLSEQRAQELQSISEISRIISSEQRLETLFPLIARLVSERFNHYHTGIFILDETRQFAVLQASNSEGGRRILNRGHRLEVGRSGIVGNVASTGKPRLALDVGADAVFFNNPDLPGTRSELALPLKIRGETIGVLDVQSTKPGAFTEGDMNTLSILADQIAIAIENARLFAKTQQALGEVQSLYSQYLQQEWKSFARKGIGIGYQQTMAGGKPLDTRVESEEIREALNQGTVVVREGAGGESPSSLAVPVKLRGQTIGVLNVTAPTPGRKWNKDEINLAQAISERLALALDNARLLQESQRLAAKEQKIGEVTAKIGASINIRNVLETAVEELGRALPGSEVIIQFQGDNQNHSGQHQD